MLAMEGCGGTDQPRIVQRLYYWHARLATSIIGGRRNQRKRVVKVYKIRFLPMEEGGDFSPTVSRPRRPAR
jgi:hypothetical protein